MSKKITPDKIINGIKQALIECDAATLQNGEALDKLLDEVVKKDITDYAIQENKKKKHTVKEIEAMALEFSRAESYGKVNADLWKGFVFGFKKAQSIKTKKP